MGSVKEKLKQAGWDMDKNEPSFELKNEVIAEVKEQTIAEMEAEVIADSKYYWDTAMKAIRDKRLSDGYAPEDWIKKAEKLREALETKRKRLDEMKGTK